MTKQKAMSNKQREKELVRLVSDGAGLGFSSILMLQYDSELFMIRQEIKEEKEKRKQWLKQ